MSESREVYPASGGLLRDVTIRRLVRKHSGRVLLVTISLFFVVAAMGALAPLVTARDPGWLDPMQRLLPPSRGHPLGTDHLGRDVFARVLYGTRLSLFVGFSVSFLTAIFGCVIGVTSAITRLDNWLMRSLDGLMAFPAILLALGLVAVFGASIVNVIAAIVLVYIPRTARLVRGVVVTLKAEPFIEAAVSLGSGITRIVWKHILPNVLPPLVVQATFTFAYAMQIEAALSFLGVGVPPDYPTWGNILQESRLFLKQSPWITLSASVMLVVVVLTINIMGDSLRDYLDPRLRRLAG